LIVPGLSPERRTGPPESDIDAIVGLDRENPDFPQGAIDTLKKVTSKAMHLHLKKVEPGFQ
jgi:hypothetical protein